MRPVGSAPAAEARFVRPQGEQVTLSRAALCGTVLVLATSCVRQPGRFLYAWLDPTAVNMPVPGSRDTAVVTVDHQYLEVVGRVSQPAIGGEIVPQVVQQGHLIILQMTSGPGPMQMVGSRTYRVYVALLPGSYTVEVQHGWAGLSAIPRLTYRRRYSVTVLP